MSGDLRSDPYADWWGGIPRRLRPNVGVNDDRLGSSVVMLGDGSDGFVAGDLGGVGGS
jgi:hypothetical protein